MRPRRSSTCAHTTKRPAPFCTTNLCVPCAAAHMQLPVSVADLQTTIMRVHPLQWFDHATHTVTVMVGRAPCAHGRTCLWPATRLLPGSWKRWPRPARRLLRGLCGDPHTPQLTARLLHLWASQIRSVCRPTDVLADLVRRYGTLRAEVCLCAVLWLLWRCVLAPRCAVAVFLHHI